MDAVLQVVQQPIDLKGQQLSHWLYRIIITLAGILGVIAGYVTQDFAIATWIILGGTLVACLVCIPPWPFYNQNPFPFKLRVKPVDGTKNKASRSGRRTQ